MHKAPRFRATRHADSVLSRARTSVSRACTRKYYLYVRRRGEVKSGERERRITRGWKEQQRLFASRTACLSSARRTPEKPDSRGIVARFHCFVRTLTVHASFHWRAGKIPLINCCRRLGDKCRGGRFVRGEINYGLLPPFFLIFLIGIEVW